MYLTGIVSYLVAWLILGRDSRDQLTKESSMNFMVIDNIHMILVLPLTITIPLLFLSLLTFFLYIGHRASRGIRAFSLWLMGSCPFGVIA